MDIGSDVANPSYFEKSVIFNYCMLSFVKKKTVSSLTDIIILVAKNLLLYQHCSTNFDSGGSTLKTSHLDKPNLSHDGVHKNIPTFVFLFFFTLMQPLLFSLSFLYETQKCN